DRPGGERGRFRHLAERFDRHAAADPQRQRPDLELPNRPEPHVQLLRNGPQALGVRQLVVQKTNPPPRFLPDPDQHFGYDLNFNIATLTFTTVPLADGNYTAAITGPITDVAGNNLANGGSLNFFTLVGDTDANRNVNVADLANLAGNFGKTNGQTWING